ncbi:MAG TPA: hypothetical protein VK205_01345 [Prolixibacteraceae bacterium]|nr:hypothetical protein [Prolixibacteraceae bacterium]
MDFSEEGLHVNQTIGYASFEEAFRYISKFQWHKLYLRMVHEDYRIPVLEQLMEVLNGERGEGEYYKARKLYEHQELLSAAICRDASGVWRYTLEDNSCEGGFAIHLF